MNRTPDNLNLIQKAVLAAEAAFYKLFPGAKEKYNTDLKTAAAVVPTSLAPLPQDEEPDMMGLHDKNTITKENLGSASSSNINLPSFVETGASSKEKGPVTPLTPADIARITAANKNVFGTHPVDNKRVANPNNNNVNVGADVA